MGLNATVTPGITVSSSTLLNAANLNLLGTPTVSITGAIDASDIGANTVGSSELQDDAVKEQHIGSIGGNNWILKGESATSSVGVDSLARNDSNETQISLLVNDKTTLGARYITGAIEATTSGSNKLNLAIAEDSISSAMLQDSALTRKVSIKDIQPGGGIGGRDGVASTSSSAVTGGLIVFEPDGSKADINGTDYYGKPKVLQPTSANQYLKSADAQGKLEFGSLTGLPAALVSAYASAHVNHDSEATSGSFVKIYGTSNIHLIRRIELTSPTVNYGVLRVFFTPNAFSVGDNLKVFGNAVSGHVEHQLIPAVVSSAAEQSINSSGDVDTSNGTTHPYVDVKFIRSIETGTPSAQIGGYLQNPNYIQLTFYKS